MPEENKNLEKEFKVRKYQKIGKIIFWIATIVLMTGMFLGFLTFGRGYEWDFFVGIMTIAIIGGSGLILALIGLAVKRKTIKKYVLILFLCGVFASIFGGFYGNWSKNLFPKIAVDIKSPLICQIIAYGWNRDDCYINVAKAMKDITPCNKLSHKGDRYYCYKEIAEITKDKSICEKIPFSQEEAETDHYLALKWPLYISEIKEDCYKSLALLLNDDALCKEIQDWGRRDECYFELAFKAKDQTLCENIRNPRTKDECCFIIAGKPIPTISWLTYRFDVQLIKQRWWANISGSQEIREKMENIIKERKVDKCKFEVKYPPGWKITLMPSGAIFPDKLYIYKPGRSEACYFMMSLYGNPEKEKYCFPISFSIPKEGLKKARCKRILNQILSTFKFIEDKTANWKTYRNEEYGFEIKYPSNFFVESEGFQPQEPVVFIVSFADEQWKNKGVHNPAVYIYVIKTTLSSQEWLEENGTPISVFCGGPEEPCPKKSYLYYGVSNVKEVNINNTPVLQFQHYGVSGSNKSTLFKKEPDTLYKIDAHSSGIGIFPQDIYDQMLSTFRFLE